MDDQPGCPDPQVPATIFTPHRRTQALVLLACIVCVLLYWWGARATGVPPERGFQGSLLQQPGWPLAIVTTYLILVCAAALATLIAGRSWFFSGPFAATIGLMALSIRGGPMRYVLFDAAAHGAAQRVFLRLLVEQCLLFFAIALLWWFFWSRYQVSLPPPDPLKKKAHDLSAVVLALAAQTIIFAVVVLLLTPTDAKKQALVSLFIAGWASTALAEYFFPDAQAPGWYWMGPFFVGAVGYLLAYFNAQPWTDGSPLGTLANLARPLPLDYASAAVAGALLGYWTSGQRPHVAFSLGGGRATTAPDSPGPSGNGDPRG